MNVDGTVMERWSNGNGIPREKLHPFGRFATLSAETKSLMNKARTRVRSTGNKLRDTQPLEIIMSYPLHLSNPITCIRLCVRARTCVCTLASLTPLNEPYIQASAAVTRPGLFAFSGFYPAKQRSESTKDFPPAASCTGIIKQKWKTGPN